MGAVTPPCTEAVHCTPTWQVPKILQSNGGDYASFPLCSAPPSSPPAAGRRLDLAASSGWSEPEIEELLRQHVQHAQRGASAASAADSSAASALAQVGPFARATTLPTFGAALARASSPSRQEDGRLEQLRAFVQDLLGPQPDGAGAGGGDGALFTKALREMAKRRAAAAKAGDNQVTGRRLKGFDESAATCLTDASVYCLSTEIISECPGALELMRAKTIPFSSEANTAAIGELRYDPTGVAQHGQMPPLAVAPARLLCLLRACLAALGQLGTPRVRPSHWAPSHRLGGSSEPPPRSPISLRLSLPSRWPRPTA